MYPIIVKLVTSKKKNDHFIVCTVHTGTKKHGIIRDLADSYQIFV